MVIADLADPKMAAQPVVCSENSARISTPPPMSSLCCRSLLRSVLRRASQEFSVGFGVGVEIEFALVHCDASTTTSPSFVDRSSFASLTTLNEQDRFVEDAYEQLRQQDIQVELLHSESAPGQVRSGTWL